MSCAGESDNISAEFQAALVQWANESGCDCIDIEDDSQFVAVWGFCLLSALVVCFVVTFPFLPRCPCRRRASISQQEIIGLKKAQEDEWEDDDELDPTPNIEKAKEHWRRTSPTKDGEWRPIWATQMKELSEIGGIGTQLYFRLLRNLGIVFCYMAALTCASIAFNVASNFAPDTGNLLTKTTAGNIGASIAATPIEPEDRLIVLKDFDGGCQGTAVTKMTAVLGWLDLLGIAVFLFAIGIFRFHSVPKISRQCDRDQITPKDFSVEIDKLPRSFPGSADVVDDKGTTRYEQELSELIVKRVQTVRDRERKRAGPAAAAPAPPPAEGGEGGEAAEQQQGRDDVQDCPVKVEELVLVRDYRGRLRRLKANAERKKDLAIAKFVGDTAKAEKLEKKIDATDEKINRKLGSEESLPVVRAYAILSTAKDARRLQVDYRFTTYSSLRQISQCLGRCGVFEGCCPQRQRMFHNRALRIKQAPEPSDIIWENQDVPYWNRKLRQLFIALIFLLILIVSFTLVYAANFGAKSNQKSNNLFLGRSTCDPDPSRLDADDGADVYMCLVQNATTWSVDWVKNHGTSDEKACYCGSIGYMAIARDPMLLNGVCNEWVMAVGSGIAIGVIATGIVISINVICKFVLLALAEMEKPLSYSALNAAKMVKIFALQTLNTGFVIFCVNFAPPDWVPLGNVIFLGEFRDAVRGWYVVVGAAIMSNMLANAVTPAATNVGLMATAKVMRLLCQKRKKHQTQLKALYTNPEFDMAARFAQLLNTVYVTLAYSAGMPMLYIFAALYMFFTYWADKIVLLWGSRRPPALDAQIPKQAASLMMYAVPLHCVFAIWMFGQPCVFPSNKLGGTLKTLADQGQASAGGAAAMAASDGVMERLQKESTWMIFAFIVCLLVLWLLWTILWILGGTLGEFFKCFLVFCCPKGKRVAAEGIADTQTWSTARVHIETNFPPASYRKEKHPSFRTFGQFMGTTGSMGGTGRLGSSGNFKADADAKRASSSSSHEGAAGVLSDEVVKHEGDLALETPDSATMAAKSVTEDGAAELGATLKPEAAGDAPVDKDLAKAFLDALKAEYVNEESGAVGKLYDDRETPEDQRAALAPIESSIRDTASVDRDQAIKDTAAKWGLEG